MPILILDEGSYHDMAAAQTASIEPDGTITLG
jgi:hypothetical protein